MENLNSPTDNVLHQAIMEISEPVLFKKILQDAKDEYAWKLFEWNLLELVEQLGDTKLTFRIGYNVRSMTPQWEEDCSTISMTLSEFVRNVSISENDTKWYYYDYKYMQEWFKDKPEILNSITWKRFGIDKNGADSTLWIGSKGAHTNCHQDSYGCNLIAQIHGSKQWLLFPPNSSQSLQPTRIPYEESTVYSKYNFFCPTEEDEANILKIQEKPKLVTLEPGDVLFIPPGWWHYVESLDLTVSVNIWLPIKEDYISRVKEAIVKLLVAGIGKNVCNMTEGDCTVPDCINLLNITLEQCKNMKTMESPYKKMKHSTWTAKDLVEQYPVHVKLLHELEMLELEKFLKMKRKRFPENSVELLKDNHSEIEIAAQNKFSTNQQLSKDIVNALCHPDVVNKVTELLLS